MKSRRICREAALQALYLCDAQGELSLEAAAIFLSHFLTRGFNDEGDDAPPQEVHPFYQEILEGVVGNLEAIDKAIGLASTNWSVARMGLVERNIIRIAVYEMLYRSDVPATVSINEAIEIAKEFASPEGPTFINGVLDKVAHQNDAHGTRQEG